MKPLLVLVDLQRDFLAAEGLEPAAGGIVERASVLLRHCRACGVPVAHVWLTVTREPDNRMIHWKESGLWRGVQGTPGHEPPPMLAPLAHEPVIHKTVFSAFAADKFHKLIQASGADTLWIAGLHLHACVRQTVLDAYQAGLRVWVADDAVGSNDPVHAAITRRYLEARSIRFLTVEELLQAPSNSAPAGAGGRGDGRAAAQVLERAMAFAAAWRAQPAEARSRLILNLASRLTHCEYELAELAAREIGKPVRYGRVEVQRTVEMLRDVARCSQTSEVAQPSDGARVRWRPHGVVAVITPWNNPLYIALGKIAPAVLFGNTVVWKPAPEARAVSTRLLKLIEAANWPKGLVNLLEGRRQEAVQLMSDRRVGAVTLTGSSAAGFAAQEICARRRVPLQAELGGNNAAIVWPDADLAEAARRVAAGAFEMAGQRCTANRRVIIHEQCREQFLQLLQSVAAELKWGDPLDEATHIGPLVSERHRERVAAFVARAEVVCGPAFRPLGDAPPSLPGVWCSPAILCCEDLGAEIVQEETFGPVLVVQTARDWEQAIRLCNGVRQGLVASIFTRSSDIKDRFLQEAQAGILKLNQSTADAAVGVPFGGWKASGLGPPEHGACDRDFFTRPQTVYE